MIALPQLRQKKVTLSVPVAAARLGISKRTLYDYCQKGLLPHVRIVRRVMILESTVNELLAAGDLPASGGVSPSARKIERATATAVADPAPGEW